MEWPDVSVAIETLEQRRQALVDGSLKGPRLAQILKAIDGLIEELREEQTDP
jgi:hypothetical protein